VDAGARLREEIGLAVGSGWKMDPRRKAAARYRVRVRSVATVVRSGHG